MSDGANPARSSSGMTTRAKAVDLAVVRARDHQPLVKALIDPVPRGPAVQLWSHPRNRPFDAPVAFEELRCREHGRVQLRTFEHLSDAGPLAVDEAEQTRRRADEPIVIVLISEDLMRAISLTGTIREGSDEP